MKVEADRECFVCGPENPVGLKAEFVIDAMKMAARAQLALGERYQGWRGVVHGGIIAALLDEAAIYACRPISTHAVTAGLNVRFLRPVATGDEVAVVAEVSARRRSLVTVVSRLFCRDQLMAEADVKVHLLKQTGEGAR